jgi:hypothetical protein
MCGSEGTLGISTEIIVRLVPSAPAKATLQAIYPDLDDAATTVSAIIGSGIVPTTLELIDRTVLDVISNYGGARFSEEAEALLLIEVDGEDVLVEAQGKRIEEFCRKRGAVQVERASTPEEAEKLWQARRTAFGAVASLRPNCIVEDATVPVRMLPAIIRKIVEITNKYDLKIGVLAHAGDGNLHPLIMTDLRDREEMARVDKAMEELYEAAIGMGGTLSGEHGIGIAKDRFMGMEFNQASMDLMRGIKRVFDPNNIMNPGSFLNPREARLRARQSRSWERICSFSGNKPKYLPEGIGKSRGSGPPGSGAENDNHQLPISGVGILPSHPKKACRVALPLPLRPCHLHSQHPPKRTRKMLPWPPSPAPPHPYLHRESRWPSAHAQNEEAAAKLPCSAASPACCPREI